MGGGRGVGFCFDSSVFNKYGRSELGESSTYLVCLDGEITIGAPSFCEEARETFTRRLLEAENFLL